mmetsp:Transcript_85273/g.231431  ORF Transcript_85273/g.231431 Transcript_85273/m.231431 type:complete len:224 (+) Transcript_85273:483-1154(+)
MPSTSRSCTAGMPRQRRRASSTHLAEATAAAAARAVQVCRRARRPRKLLFLLCRRWHLPCLWAQVLRRVACDPGSVPLCSSAFANWHCRLTRACGRSRATIRSKSWSSWRSDGTCRSSPCASTTRARSRMPSWRPSSRPSTSASPRAPRSTRSRRWRTWSSFAASRSEGPGTARCRLPTSSSTPLCCASSSACCSPDAPARRAQAPVVGLLLPLRRCVLDCSR